MEKFIKTATQVAAQIEGWFLKYHNSDFNWHKGYQSIAVSYPSVLASVKTNGYFAAFGLEKQNGAIVYWTIPTGKPGFAFWNVTKRCEMIGRKYVITGL